MKKRTKISDVAACGMNCSLCIGYIRAKNKCDCDGCLTPNTKCSKKCTLRYCTKRKGKYCNQSCTSFPCQHLKNPDRRYRAKYDMSMIENIGQIEEVGIRQFVRIENTRRVCVACGELICGHQEMHNGSSFRILVGA